MEDTMAESPRLLTYSTPLSSKRPRTYKKLILRISYNDNIYTFSLDHFCRIITVKYVLKDHTNVDAKFQILSFNGRNLDDLEVLSDINVEQKRTISFVMVSTETAKIHIFTPKMHLSCNLPKVTNIRELQMALGNKTSIPVEQQYLILNGQILDHEKTLADYSVTDGSTLELFRRLTA